MRTSLLVYNAVTGRKPHTVPLLNFPILPDSSILVPRLITRRRAMMDDLGNLGEFLGAIGVVVTLIYLARFTKLFIVG